MHTVKEYPEGYPQLAAWINTDDNFRVYRRFGELRNRVLLQYQFKLAKLEAVLQKLDEDDSNSKEAEDNFRLSSIEYDQSQDDRRQSIIDDIDATLEKYEEISLFNRKDDAVILVQDQDSPFHAYLEGLLQNYAPDSFQARVVDNFFVRSVVTFVTVGLLMIPIGFLFKSNSASQIKVAVVLLFVLLFAAAISIFSQLRHYELFAATAA
ncbi:hypothetical protein BKCO1_17000149 [Neofusicoccum parvum]|uniref:Uncharacterized protein n=1 Tax=Neofusicoccum parvum TaxID=310453 RepID=A0ACB5S4D8_9PEZI|nr:hypothetical protein BKCO1_17000149 [Neofusicoccum parvum]